MAGFHFEQLVMDTETPVSLYLKLTQDKPYSFLLESVEQGRYRGRYSVIGCQPDVIWTCKNGVAYINGQAQENAPLKSLRNLIKESRIDFPKELPSMAAGIFGNLGFDTIRMLETLPDAKDSMLDIPDCCLFRPTLIAVMDHIKDVTFLCAPVYATAQSAQQKAILEKAAMQLKQPLADAFSNHKIDYQAKINPVSNVSKPQFLEMVQRCKDYIIAGDAFQIVPSQRFQQSISIKPFDYYRRLRRLNPSPYLFHIKFDDYVLVGSSPETLVKVEEGQVYVRPIAGTRPRGATIEQDQQLAEELLNDPKERAEHLMLLDLGRNDIGRVSKPETVEVTDRFTVEYYSHVMHIVSQVRGKLRDDKDCLDALLAGFPAGTVSGAPKIRAMEIIHELEPQGRSFYAGGVGYFSSKNTIQGEMDMCIALRTALIKNNTLYVQAGGGVVADSDPEMEYAETVNKAMALLRACAETHV